MSTETKTIQPADVAAEIVATKPAPETPAVTSTAAQQPGTSQTAPADLPKADKRGVPFDPNRHLPKIHPVTGCWMPKKLGKAGKPANASQTPEPENGATWSDAEKAQAAPETTPEAGNEAVTPEVVTDAPEGVTASGARRAAARALCQGVYTATGVATGNPDEAQPMPKDDKNLQETTAYVFEASGWQPGVFTALCIAFVTYMIVTANRPKNRQMLSDWWRARMAKDVTPRPQPTPGASQPAPQPQTARAAAPAVTDANDPYAQYR